MLKAIRCVSACRISLLAALFVISWLSAPLYAAPVFRMAFGQDPNQEAQYLFYQRVYTDAFKELGYEFRYRICPSKRCSMAANRGEVDGEPQRIFKYNEVYSNMVRVEEPIFVNRSIAVVARSNIRIDGLESLKNTKYRVDYIRGSVWSKNHLEPLVPPELLNEISTAKQAIKRLQAHHTDILIGLESIILQTPEFQSAPVFIAGIVGENLSYPFLYKSHKALAPKLAEVLRRMKEEGRFEQTLNQTMPFMSLKHAKN